MNSITAMIFAVLLVLTATLAHPRPPYQEHGTVGNSGSKGGTTEIPSPFPHPDAINTDACNYHGTSSPPSSRYNTFASSLVGPKGNTGLTIQRQVEYHHVGGVSVVIIEGGKITQHHWYGCQDRAAARRTTAQTIYQAASLSKFVSAIGIVKAHRSGVVDLDRTVQFYGNAHPKSLLAEWVADKFRGTTEDYPRQMPLRRLLNHTAGLDTHGINAWEPGNVPTMRDILMGAKGFDGRFNGGVEPVERPKTVILYSGGGYIVAEHILELASALSFKEYLQRNVLDPAGLSLSTFETAQRSMSNLARPFSRTPDDSRVLQTNVKAAGGLLANAREYAELVTALVNGGQTASGRRVMDPSDIEAILTPAALGSSTFTPCTKPGATKKIDQGTIELKNGTTVPLPDVTEMCIAGKFRRVLSEDGKWRGLGVKLSQDVEPDGYPRIVEHGGSQTGARTYFKIDRRTGDGIVIMINGTAEWVDGDGFTYGADPLLSAIRAAYNATY